MPTDIVHTVPAPLMPRRRMKPPNAEKSAATAQSSRSGRLRFLFCPMVRCRIRLRAPVLAANSRTAEAELRAATLRSEAASKNWLPKTGHRSYLTSLGSLAHLVVDQVLFDKWPPPRAEPPPFAVADVESLRVAGAKTPITRVSTALKLYTNSDRGARIPPR